MMVASGVAPAKSFRLRRSTEAPSNADGARMSRLTGSSRPVIGADRWDVAGVGIFGNILLAPIRHNAAGRILFSLNPA